MASFDDNVISAVEQAVTDLGFKLSETETGLTLTFPNGTEWNFPDYSHLAATLEAAFGVDLRWNPGRGLILRTDNTGTYRWDEGDPGGLLNRGKRDATWERIGPAKPVWWDETGIDWQDMVGEDDQGFFVKEDRLKEIDDLRL